jgi:hypothetical protein
MGIYDLDDKPLTAASFSLVSGQTTSMMIRIDCETDYVLEGIPVADVTIEAKHSSGSFQDIENIPLSLTPWNGTRQPFEIRFIVGSIITHKRELVPFTVRYAP